MLFNSVEFFVFFPLVVLICFILPAKTRWIFLLLSSCWFYMAWRPEFILLLFATTIFNYWLGILMDKQKNDYVRRRYLILSIFISLGFLFVFKYFNFVNYSLKLVVSSIGLNYPIPNLHLILPIGISFYTFQTMSYTIDVYKKKRKAEKHLGYFALFVTFFPQILAGPIGRSEHLLPQLRQPVQFDYNRVISGLRKMVWGLFKKILIADNLAAIVNVVYNNVHQFRGIILILTTCMFAIQIYCDFSGYSDIAIGAAKVLGIKLMENFNAPYFSRNIKEFWRKWHVSLSTWFRDYLYIPLGGNRVTTLRKAMNVLGVFLVSGLWHGANWTFVVWGFLHGVYQYLGGLTLPFRRKIYQALRLENTGFQRFIQILVSFILVTYAWVFFKANSLSDAFYITNNMFYGVKNWISGETIKQVFDVTMKAALSKYQLLACFIGILVVAGVDFQRYRGKDIQGLFKRFPAPLRWGIYYGIIILTILFGTLSAQQFIYFQF